VFEIFLHSIQPADSGGWQHATFTLVSQRMESVELETEILFIAVIGIVR
jgi:hypothetical protein